MVCFLIPPFIAMEDVLGNKKCSFLSTPIEKWDVIANF